MTRAATQRKTSRAKCAESVCTLGVTPCLLRETLQFWPLRRRVAARENNASINVTSKRPAEVAKQAFGRTGVRRGRA